MIIALLSRIESNGQIIEQELNVFKKNQRFWINVFKRININLILLYLNIYTFSSLISSKVWLCRTKEKVSSISSSKRALTGDADEIELTFDEIELIWW